MKLVKRNARYAVYDDVLDAKDFAAVWEFVQVEQYFYVHEQRWEKTWRLSDGHPFAGALVRAEVSGMPARITGSEAKGARAYPTRLAIDILIGKLLDMRDEIVDLVGISGTDYVAINARACLYPVGSALSWHTDPSPYSGAFTYYAHPKWNATWGGELIVADESTANEDLGAKRTTAIVMDGAHVVGMRQVLTPPALDHDRENEVLCESGCGDFIVSKPNRLVLMKPAIPHRIARVDACAGENVRCSISGCFVPPS
jgi:hypothetical protein